MGQKNYTAQGTIPPYRIVKFGSEDRTVVIATHDTDFLIGVTGRYKDSVVAGGQVDVIRDDFCEVELGGTVTRGQLLTTDDSGRAIGVTTVLAMASKRVIGCAEVSGVAGDIVLMMIAPCFV